MRILRLRAYYDPEKTAGIHLDHDLSEAFMNNGIYYISYTPFPTRGVSKDIKNEYKSKMVETLYNGYTVINRFAMIDEGRNPIQRAFRYLACSIKEYRLGSKEKDIDIVYSSSTPPTQGMLSALVAKKLSKKYGRKVPFVYNLQDIFPDSLVNVGMTKKGSILWRIGSLIENYTYNNADRIIVISEGFKRNIMDKGVTEEKITVVSNWVDLDSVHPIRREDNSLFDELGIDRNRFIVLYAGNLGEAQGAEVILDAAKALSGEKNIQFVVFGGGAKYLDFKNRVKKENLDNVFVTDLQPQERVPEVYSMGNVALITCKPGTGNSGMPSKTWSIMACNTPIIASFDTESDLATILNNSGSGACVEPGDAIALSKLIMRYYTDLKNGALHVGDSRQYAIDLASKSICVQKYIDTLINSLNGVDNNSDSFNNIEAQEVDE